MTTSTPPGQNVGGGNSNAPYGGAGGQYVRPEKASDYAPQPVSIPAATLAGGTTVAQAHQLMEHAARAHEKYVASIPRENFSETGLREQLSKFADTAAAKSIDTAAAAVEAREKAAVEEERKVLDALSPRGDTAAELRATRAWQRAQRVLDASEGASVIEVARKMLESADRESLGVILEELPSFLQSRGVESDWIPTAVGSVVPELGAAQRKVQRARQSRQIVDHNRKVLQAAISEGRSRATTLVKPMSYDPDA